MGIELKIQQMTMDGLPYTCPECGTNAFTLDSRGMADILTSVWATCSSYHSWEVMILDGDDVRAINAARTGRQRAEDVDTFRVIVGGAVIEGVLHPDVILDDLKRAAKDVYWKRIIKTGLRRQKNAAKRAIKRPAKNAVASVKAAALGAAWGIQAGGYETDPDYQPEPVTPCGAGCDRGYFEIESNIHNTTRVKCTVCAGTGEAD